MARKYKRKANGQFAGGGGGGSTASKGAKAKPKAATNSNAKPKSLAGKAKRRARTKKVLMFAARNPRLVGGAIGLSVYTAANGRTIVDAAVAAKKVSNSTKFRNDLKAATRGLGSQVGSRGLKATKPTRKGVYRI